MKSLTDTISTILLFGAAQGFILAFVLLTIRHGHRVANRILATMLMFFSFSIVFHVFTHSKQLSSSWHHPEVGKTIFLLIAPLIYFYAKALTRREFRFTRKDLLHFLPFGICALLVIPLYFQPNHEIVSQSSPSHTVSPIDLIISGALFLQTLIYMLVIIQALRNHSKNIRETFSSIEKINLNWLRFLITGYIITWFVAISLEGAKGGHETWNYYWIVVAVFMYAIGYMGLRQPAIFSGFYLQDLVIQKSTARKYEKSTLTLEKANEYLQKLEGFMASEKPYLLSDLTLPALAKKLAISTHHLSQIINEKLQQNFYDFVNSHRVEEAKKRIVAPENVNVNIAEIGFDVGFNSISAFISAFKKHTRMTPSMFREQRA